jgi:hypothetical protein
MMNGEEGEIAEHAETLANMAEVMEADQQAAAAHNEKQDKEAAAAPAPSKDAPAAEAHTQRLSTEIQSQIGLNLHGMARRVARHGHHGQHDHDHEVSNDDLNVAFTFLDADHNGYLDRAEVVSMLTAEGEGSSVALSSEQVDKVFERLDVNHDGKVLAEQFYSWVLTGDTVPASAPAGGPEKRKASSPAPAAPAQTQLTPAQAALPLEPLTGMCGLAPPVLPTDGPASLKEVHSLEDGQAIAVPAWQTGRAANKREWLEEVRNAGTAGVRNPGKVCTVCPQLFALN